MNKIYQGFINKGYNKALKELLEIAEDIDDTYMIEIIKNKLKWQLLNHKVRYSITEHLIWQ